MEIGMQTNNVIMDEAPQEGYRRMKAAGFDCADFSLNFYFHPWEQWPGGPMGTDGFFDMSLSELEDHFAPYVNGAKAAGIRHHQLHMPCPIVSPKRDEATNRYLYEVAAPKTLHIAKILGLRYVVVHGFKMRYFLGSEAAEWAETEKFLKSLAPLAKELGVVICMENLYEIIASHVVEGPCCDARLAAERIDRLNAEFGAEVFGFCFDTGHANLVGVDFRDFITALGPRLKVLHIHDNDGLNDIHQIPYTFTRGRYNAATTDWKGFIRGLRAVKFDGVLSFETAPVLDAFPDDLKDEALRFTAAIGRYFASQLG